MGKRGGKRRVHDGCVTVIAVKCSGDVAEGTVFCGENAGSFLVEVKHPAAFWDVEFAVHGDRFYFFAP